MHGEADLLRMASSSSTSTLPDDSFDAGEEQLMPDDRPPSCGRNARGVGWGKRWWAAWIAVGVLIFLMILTGVIVVFLQSATNRQKFLHYFFVRNPGVTANIGVLSSGRLGDEEIYAAAEKAVRDHQAAYGEVDIQLRLAFTGTTILGLLLAFDELWNEGIRVFITGGEDEFVKAVCHHLQHTGKQALILSPTAFKPEVDCPQLVSLYPDHGALIAAEMARIKENGLTTIIPVVTATEMGLVSQLMATGAAQGLQVDYPVQLQSQNTSLAELQGKLLAYPRTAIWLSLGRKLPQLLGAIGSALQGHLIMIHSHPTDLSELLRHPEARRVAELNAVCATEWAGSSQVNTVARRHLLASLQPKDPLIGALAYDVATLAIFALSSYSSGKGKLLDSEIVKEALHSGITRPDYILNASTSGFVVWKRLVMQQLIGKEVLQESPWLMEGLTKVAGKGGNSWSVIQQTHAPVHIVTKEEVMALAKQGKCDGEFWVKVTAHDPLSHRPVTTSWPLSKAPKLLLLPNGSPNGFILQTWCDNVHKTRLLELGCQGAASHNETLVCVAVSEGSENRRSVRSIVSRYGYPNRRRKYPIRRQEQDGPFTTAVKKMKAFFNHKDFKGMIPQIGGCVGATGGCSFCFIFLSFNDVAVQPGVCYGACSVAVGGSCTTLLAKGIQYHIDHTVICTELFTQGRLALSSYMADASYGSRLAAKNPRALRGYQTLAAPLVAVMQVSPAVSSVVELIAQPWMRHMEHEEGLRAEDDALGRLMTGVGLPMCCLVATILDHIDTIALVTFVALIRRARR